MVCTKCDSCKSKVVESRDSDSGDSIRRRRECLDCGQRFTTYERLEVPNMVVIKSGGNREAYNREKVFRGVQRACEKSDITVECMEKVVDNVERSLRSGGQREIESKQVGKLIMNELGKISDIAYIRFASVYLQLSDIEVLEGMIKKLRSAQKHV